MQPSPPLRCYFVYRVLDEAELDVKTAINRAGEPIGGVTVRDWDETEAVAQAFDLAEARFPRRTWEIFLLVRAFSVEGKRQVKRMEKEERAAYREFEELMTA